MNLGSPDSTEVKDVKKYLKEFLMDKRVIDVPFLLRTFLVKVMIVPSRSPRSAEAYKSIWWKEGSPLIVLTKQLQQAVQKNFEEPVESAMTIWAAKADFLENEIGSIEAGKKADFIMLYKDLMKVSEQDVLNTKVVATYSKGGKVYGR